MGIIRTAFRGFFKPMVDIPAWVGLKYLRNTTSILLGYCKNLFVIKSRPKGKENFSDVVKRMYLTEDDLEKRAQQFIYQVYIYLFAMLGTLIYAFYLLFLTHIVAGCLVILLAGFFLLKACSVHFWYFQIKERKLNCSLREWLHGSCSKNSSAKGNG